MKRDTLKEYETGYRESMTGCLCVTDILLEVKDRLLEILHARLLWIPTEQFVKET